MHEPGLADPRLAGEVHHHALCGARALPGTPEGRHLLDAVDEWGARPPRLAFRSRRRTVRGQHSEHAHRAGYAFQLLRAEVLGLETLRHERERRTRHHDRAGRRDGLNPGCDVQRVADGSIAAHFPGHDHPRVNADSHLQSDPERVVQSLVERIDLVQDVQRGPHGAIGVVLVRTWISEIGDNPVALILGHVAVEAENRSRAGFVITTEQITEVLWVELLRERGRAHQVGEQNSEMATPRNARLSRVRRGRDGVRKRRPARTAEAHSGRTLKATAAASHLGNSPPRKQALPRRILAAKRASDTRICRRPMTARG